jgi:hexokinase
VNRDRLEAMGFLRSQGLLTRVLDPEAILDAFLREMKAGLDGRRASLAMIPTFLSVDRPLPAGRSAIVIDAGGTHLRTAVVRFDRGGAAMRDFSVQPMPGSVKPVGRAAFFEQVAAMLSPLLAASDDIGFCFSYPTDIAPDGDGRLLAWTKQIQAPDVVGEKIGAGLAAVLERHGHRKRITLLNDTVATLLAGRSLDPGGRFAAYVGFILGTGTNTAYVERHACIRKQPGLDPRGSQAINCESGAFSRCPRTAVDEAFDASTVDPGQYRFEKMISGAYVGGLCLQLLREAAARGLLGEAAAEAVRVPGALATRDVDRFVHGTGDAASWPGSTLPARDVERMRVCCAEVFARAALLAAVNIAAAVVRGAAASGARRPVCVNADGSMFHKTPGFRARVAHHLRALLDPRGLQAELCRVQDAPLIGAAIAALTR